ncbi:D-alanyl-D-alanine carboxypeptidase, serine-type, PBP4 family [Rivularia sp. PCC 7116]|uniref:D-alanyl-D-alanine carboxypeptidase/D-alanyl-D-alanine endopeptidase n=1 Tax=Rivularia sp. PCC 7116 TaxID=373994 RepID=UPI00029F1B5E|nr:D-alanyl-D-alanine carboxypeptidase/D-alanyl-D-alanine-endopeptidase [Rivularia sp. PCC 7116]AFY57968.1 D-alanyl-D-alanine carboxypeptidase, serine-type, PBP4 family [Rivularia sp. PCC 7116]
MSKKSSLSLLLLFFGVQFGVNQQAATAQTNSGVVIPTTPRNTPRVPSRTIPTLPRRTPTTPRRTPAPSGNRFCASQLNYAVDSITNRTQFNRTHWGIMVQNLGSPRTLYSRNHKKYFTPASVTKLMTTAAALQTLSPNYRIRTSVYETGNGVVQVVGRGDPSLKSEQLEVLAKQLRQKGVRRINRLIANDAYFKGEAVEPSWMWEDVQFYYGAPVNSLMLNENAAVIRLYPQRVGRRLLLKWDNPLDASGWKVVNQTMTARKGTKRYIEVKRDLKGQTLYLTGQLPEGSRPDITAIAVFNPIQNFLTHFRQSLRKQGVSVKGAYWGTTKTSGRELAAVQSPPLSELITETNINSNNLYAEALLKALATKKPLERNQTTVDAGLEVMKSTLTRIGVEPTTYKLVDGSGLSRKDLISPQALVQTLQGMAKSRYASVFRASLPVAGKNGTLKYRFKDIAPEGLVQAKTGTMTGVVTLAGYVNAPNYGPVAFSIMVNQTEQPIRTVRNAIDEIVVHLSKMQRC